MRRILVLLTVTLALLGLVGCAQPIGTVGFVNGQRISEAEVDRAAAAFARYGYDRGQVTLFVVKARAAQAIMAERGLTPSGAAREAASGVPEIAVLLNDPATRDVTTGVLDFESLEQELQPHGLAIAVADAVVLDPRYGTLTAVPDSQGRLVYVLSGYGGDQPGALSTVARR